MYVRRTRSRWWFLLPVTLQFIGGIIAYFALRDDDPAKARNCLLLGAVLTAVGILLLLLPLILLLAFSIHVEPPIGALPPAEYIFLNSNLEI